MILLLALVTYAPAAIVRGVVIAALWGWYITPWFGVRPVSVVEAIGLSIFATLLIGHQRDNKRIVTTRTVIRGMVDSIGYSLIVLLFGWLWSFAL
jgi:hypothetical protein